MNKKHSVKKSWTDLKTHITLATPLQYDKKKLKKYEYFKVFVKKNNYKYFTNIYGVGHRKHNTTDYTDFATNYQLGIDANPPTDSGVAEGSKLLVHQTSRVVGTVTYFTCASDDSADFSKIGGNVGEDEKLKGHHEIGDAVSESKYLTMNSVANTTYMHEGYLQWKDALNDELIVEIVPQLTAVSAGSSTFYNLYGGYLVIPAAGDGTLNVDTMALVEMPVNEFGTRSAGYWNADYNTTTKLFENVTAAPAADGVYNMFTVEVVLDRFANKVPLLGNGFMNLQTSDASHIGHGMRLKVTGTTIGTDHEWWWNGFVTFHRNKTV